MKVCLVARQAGTAAAFAPLAALLAASDQLGGLLLYPDAAAFLRRESPDGLVRATEVDDASVIERLHGSVLVTGTSEEARADRDLWRWARGRRIASLAYLDQWVNLERRFVSKNADDWPDALATISETDARLAAALAPPNVVLRTTGSPAIEAFGDQVRRIRQAKTGRVVFATEPITGMSADDYRAANGFTDADAFRMAARALAGIGGELLVRLHPRDSKERWTTAIHEANRPGLTAGFEPPLARVESAARAHVVCGTRSMFLLEAACAGVPVVSLQPGRRSASPLTDGHPGILTAESEHEANAAIAAALSTPSNEAGADLHRGAGRRLVDAIAELAGSQSPR